MQGMLRHCVPLMVGAAVLLSGPVGAADSVGAADVPLLANRFRIDYGVKEVTFIIHRKPDSVPVVLVQPDGSKLYSIRHPAGQVGWQVTPRADLITIRDPMPGPWQAIGDTDPDNRIRLLTDVQLAYDPIPLRLYQNEVVKLTSRLVIEGAISRDPAYLDNLAMTARLQRFHEGQGGDGEPLEDIEIGRYLDDGKGLDEVPHDGVLTAETTLLAPPGKYRAVITTGNEIFTRARHQEILLYPLPFRYELLAPSEGQPPRLTFIIDKEELDPASVVLAGVLTDSTGHPLSFRGNTVNSTMTVILPLPSAVGQYRVSGTLYGTSVSGREVRIALPEKSFNIYPPPPPPEPVVSQSLPAPAPVAEPEASSWWPWVVGGVAVLLTLAAAAGMLVLQKRKALRRALAAQQEGKISAKAPPTEVDLNQMEQ